MSDTAPLILGIESSCDETGVALVQAHDRPVPQLLSHAWESGYGCAARFRALQLRTFP